eukprot:693637-Pyramimonas_sp.AAC.1
MALDPTGTSASMRAGSSTERGRHDTTERATGQNMIPQSPFPGEGSADARLEADLKAVMDPMPPPAPAPSHTQPSVKLPMGPRSV